MPDTLTATRMGGRTYLLTIIDGERRTVDCETRLAPFSRSLTAAGWNVTVNAPTALVASR